ncbi:LOW QUALITY PROTEIN: putative ankyrin repeat protein RF_0381 [Gigantopelta aegis]|uniref:LOW QUALITY PROTEIN: putative ankyrin repeat protein RF_0381 n=1 Tax=Gigantopelta aegis TaxID=1735272 RepID=UPI001B8878AF|nr:LOW QUALITY PROTEIN: putative ankyrin repeat protein RF_0381 [Gigantopelta aegis]
MAFLNKTILLMTLLRNLERIVLSQRYFINLTQHMVCVPSSGQCFPHHLLFVQKLFKHTDFQDHELLESFLGCVINGNTRSLDILTKYSESSSVLDRVKSATIGDILQNETNTGKLMKKLTNEQDDGSSSQNPFPGDENDGLLHLACIRSHKDVVERLLKLGCAVDALGQLGRTPLMYASRGGDHEVADILLKAGADINIMDEEGACALHLAARGGHLHVMKIFLENGVNINEKGEHGRTPLLYACRYGYPEFVKFCLENGGDTSLKCDTDSCLHLACKSGNLKTVKILLDKDMDINEPGQFRRTPIMYACRHGHLGIVNHMRLKGADLKVVDDRGEDIFHLSVLSGNVDLAKEMLPPDATRDSVCDSQHRSPFEKASAMGHFDMIKYFIDNKKELVPVPLCLISACYNGHMTLIKMLIDMVDDINVKGEKGRTALIRACLGGQTETAELLISKKADVQLVDDYDISNMPVIQRIDLVKLLLKQGFTVNTPCQNGMTSLMCACRRNHKDLFEFLAEYDRNAVHTLDTFGLTCLHHSCVGRHDNQEILEMLFDLGMNNVNCRDDGLKTPAMYASKNGLTNILHSLVEHGADLNLKDKNGQTCLHYACFSKNENTIRYLVGCGVYINCEDNKKTTPLMKACFRGNPVAVDVLLELGADAKTISRFLLKLMSVY